MLNTPLQQSNRSDGKPNDVEQIVKAGPRGAVAIAGVATFIVFALWLMFYLFVFLPRGGAQ